MISPAHGQLAYSLARHYFGDTVALVLESLFNHDQASLRVLRSSIPQVNNQDLKKALLVLVKYQLVDYVKTVKNFSHQHEYSVVSHRIFSFFRLPRFLRHMSAQDDPIVPTLVTCLAERALLKRDQLLDLVSKTSNASLKKEVLRTEIDDLITKMISQRFIVQTSDNLCLNLNRFDRQYRDHLITETVHAYYNKEPKVKSLCAAILDLTLENTSNDAPLTAPLPLADLANVLIPGTFSKKDDIEQFLIKLANETNNRFFESSGNHPNKGPMFAINVGQVIDYLTREHLSSVITSRFGPKCCRVFRVLLTKGPLLLKQIEEIIMLPARDVREYSYMLMKEGFLRNRQVPKTPDNAPGKSVFIMSIEVERVVYDAADLCCRSMSNILMRYNSEILKNKPLLDRAKAAQAIISASSDPGADSLDDWSQYFNSHELSDLERIRQTLDIILVAKSQIDETLFLLQTWLDLRPNMRNDGG